PTSDPTLSPTDAPTKSPTDEPTMSPTTSKPTSDPTMMKPTASPTKSPSNAPTASPSKSPTLSPSISPTKSPSNDSTVSPTTSPSRSPTLSPSSSPTKSPSNGSTASPTTSPTPPPNSPPTPPTTPPPTNSEVPSLSPTISAVPSTTPTIFPTFSPTWSPTDVPTLSPTGTTSPTILPTFSPTFVPTLAPVQPTPPPSFSPTITPTVSPIDSTPQPTTCELVANADPNGRYEPVDLGEDYEFGSSIDLTDTTAMIGAPGAVSTATVVSGAAYVFDLENDGSWGETIKLSPSSDVDDKCGTSVAFAGDYYIVGCPFHDGVVGDDSGAVFIYKRELNSFQLLDGTTLFPPTNSDSELGLFGWSIAINDNGVIAVGARSARAGQGIVHIYKPDDNENWGFVQTLDPDVTQDQFNGGNFGWDVAINQDNTLLVGAPFEEGVGAMFIYKEVALNTWDEFDQLAPGNVNDDDQFGFSVAIDNSVALVGARNAFTSGDAGAGAAYIYDIPSGTDGPATFVQKLTDIDSSTDALFGHSVDLKDGRLVIGSPTRNSVGSAHLYHQKKDDSWELVGRLLGPSTSGVQFGAAAAVSKEAVMGGAPKNDIEETNSGSVFAYVVTEDIDCDGQALPRIMKPQNIDPSTPINVPINSVSLSVPGKRFLAWSSLSETEQQVAQVYLGYTKSTWDNPGTNELEEYSYVDLYQNGKAGAISLGFDDDTWDCHINHYLGYWWADMEEVGLDHYLSVLGWNKNSWDDDGPAPETEDLYWDELEPEHQAVASQLCYHKDLWDGVSIPEWDIQLAP
ncbi:hypothetical protein ACHAXR_005539, partial [Thalassiosira sp. AJA248-18]